MTVGILIHSHASDHEKPNAYGFVECKTADRIRLMRFVSWFPCTTAGQCLRVQYILQYAYAQYIMPTRTVIHQTIHQCLQCTPGRELLRSSTPGPAGCRALTRLPWPAWSPWAWASTYTRSSGDPKIDLLMNAVDLLMKSRSSKSASFNFSWELLLALARCPASSSLGWLSCSSTASGDMNDSGNKAADGLSYRRLAEECLTGVPGPELRPLWRWGLRPPTGCSSPLLCMMATIVRRKRPAAAMATQTRWCWCQCWCRFFVMARQA